MSRQRNGRNEPRTDRSCTRKHIFLFNIEHVNEGIGSGELGYGSKERADNVGRTQQDSNVELEEYPIAEREMEKERQRWHGGGGLTHDWSREKEAGDLTYDILQKLSTRQG